jgi:CAAX prenyl protease-like protein
VAAVAIQRRVLRPTWVRALPFAIYLVFLAVAAALPGLSVVDARWLYPVKVGMVAAALTLLWPRLEELAMPRLTPRDGLRALAIGIAVFVLWINLDISWASLAADNEGGGFDPRGADGRIDWLLAGSRIAGAALVVPVMEELFWRSLVMRWLDRPDFLTLKPCAVSRRALLASSMVFGLEHDLWLAGIIAGLAYGELYRRSGNLWAPILAHGVTNGLLGAWVLWSGQWHYW